METASSPGDNAQSPADNFELRKKIEEYYLPTQLIDAILLRGEIPEHTEETHIGIGFIDIADYSYLSKFLTPKENQILLNGLYTAFQSVLISRGGYLNKIEGDSMMFHFGGSLDQKTRGLELEKQTKIIARDLFYSCIEMQRICSLFNQANEDFFMSNTNHTDRKALSDAFTIIDTLRSNSEVLESLNAFFQIRIRIGASLGEVTVGNFGPTGAKQWDVIGVPVILAKRMETTAPVGGVRISEEFYQVLDRYGIIKDYCNRFRKEAGIYGSSYLNIRDDEIFLFGTVNIKEKKNASFRSYSVQVNPNLPTNTSDQIEALLRQGEPGADRILRLVQYYRGNKYVVEAIEQRFKAQGVKIRKTDLLKYIFPKKHKELLDEMIGSSPRDIDAEVEKRFSLFFLLEKMGAYQDIIKQNAEKDDAYQPFQDYEQSMARQYKEIVDQYKKQEFNMVQRAYFFNVVFPLVFASIKNSIQEYQEMMLEELEEE